MNGVMKAWWSRHWPAAMVVMLALSALLPLASRSTAHEDDAATRRHVEWPSQWEGRALRPMALSEVERRFAAEFPGAIARFSDGERVFVLREVTAPTRMLHPAADCFRGLGHRIEAERLERDPAGRLWRVFEAVPPSGDERLRVRERIESAAGGASFVDASSWFWSAVRGASTAPWLAITIVEAM